MKSQARTSLHYLPLLALTSNSKRHIACKPFFFSCATGKPWLAASPYTWISLITAFTGLSFLRAYFKYIYRSERWDFPDRPPGWRRSNRRFILLSWRGLNTRWFENVKYCGKSSLLQKSDTTKRGLCRAKGLTWCYAITKLYAYENAELIEEWSLPLHLL